MNIKEIIKYNKAYKLSRSVIQEANNMINEKLRSPELEITFDQKELIEQVKQNGFCLIEGFYDRNLCDQIVRELEQLLCDFKDQIWQDDLDADHRIFGAESKSKLINDFFQDAFISTIIDGYENSKNIKGFTMGGRLRHVEGNLGSGQGWHRDAPNKKQTKAIVYLSDVSRENGPFQYLKGSHLPEQIVKDTVRESIFFNQHRFSNEEVNSIVEHSAYDLIEFTAKAGTLIIVDTRGIHRGAPIVSGTRYALTKYTWYDMPIPEAISRLVVS